MEWILSAILLMLPPAGAQPARRSPDDAIRIVVPDNVNIARCHLEYELLWPYGGRAGWATTRPGANEYQIVMTPDTVERAKWLIGYLACPGYEIETITVLSVPELGDRRLQMHPRPLATINFDGVVRGWAATDALQYVDVMYWPYWTCEFFRRPDCGLGPWKIATVPLADDGSFSADLPDFARDAVISSFRDPGELWFVVHDRSGTGNVVFELKARPPVSVRGRLPVSASYPRVHLFDFVPP
jgi:hypothetical protein